MYTIVQALKRSIFLLQRNREIKNPTPTNLLLIQSGLSKSIYIAFQIKWIDFGLYIGYIWICGSLEAISHDIDVSSKAHDCNDLWCHLLYIWCRWPISNGSWPNFIGARNLSPMKRAVGVIVCKIVYFYMQLGQTFRHTDQHTADRMCHFFRSWLLAYPQQLLAFTGIEKCIIQLGLSIQTNWPQSESFTVAKNLIYFINCTSYTN